MNPNQIQELHHFDEEMTKYHHMMRYMGVWNDLHHLIQSYEQRIEEKIKRNEQVMISNLQESFLKRAKKMLDKAQMEYHCFLKAGDEPKENPKNV